MLQRSFPFTNLRHILIWLACWVLFIQFFMLCYLICLCMMWLMLLFGVKKSLLLLQVLKISTCWMNLFIYAWIYCAPILFYLFVLSPYFIFLTSFYHPVMYIFSLPLAQWTQCPFDFEGSFTWRFVKANAWNVISVHRKWISLPVIVNLNLGWVSSEYGINSMMLLLNLCVLTLMLMT